MPRVANRRSALAGARRHSRVGRTVRRVARRVPRSLGRLGKVSPIHHFKGIINAGIIKWSATQVSGSPMNSGVYILRLADIPNYIELAGLFEFIRVNRCRLEFMPRYNMTNMPIGTVPGTTPATVSRLPTFITGLDEVPLVAVTPSVDVALSTAWVSQTGESSGVNEMSAYQAAGPLGPDYIRGLSSAKETEVYKKHVVSFIPTFYDYVMTNNPQLAGTSIPSSTSGCFEKKQKKWLNTSFLEQVSSVASETSISVGPDMYGPVFSFSTAAVTGAANTSLELYDVKLHYSVSCRRYKGPAGPTV